MRGRASGGNESRGTCSVKESEVFSNFKRNNYFDGELLSAKDFQDEQDYLIEKRRLHNRFLHGYGVVTGLEVSISDDHPGTLEVGSGFAFDAQGNEVILPETQYVPFPDVGKKACLVITYAERETDFVPAQTSECEEMVARRVEEYAVLKLEATRAREEGSSCDEGIVLARLKKRGGAWRLDKRLEVKRVIVGS